MTKVIILGEPAEKKEGKNIEFVQSLNQQKIGKNVKMLLMNGRMLN